MKKGALFIALLFVMFMPLAYADISTDIKIGDIINSTGTKVKNNIDEMCIEAGKLLKEKEYRNAYNLADKISKNAPTYYFPYEIKAIASANMDNNLIALENIDKAIKLHPVVRYPLDLYAIRECILYDTAYFEADKSKFKYADEFKKDYDLMLEKYIFQLHPSDIEYGDDMTTLSDYIDYIVSYIVESPTYALYKVNTLLSMISVDEIKDCKYTNANMYYYKLYALAIKIALDTCDKDFKQTNTTRKKVLSMIRRKTSSKGDKYHDDFTKYLIYKFSWETKKADSLMASIVIKRDRENAYSKGFLYEDDIDYIIDYVKKYENFIWNYCEW